MGCSRVIDRSVRRGGLRAGGESEAEGCGDLLEGGISVVEAGRVAEEPVQVAVPPSVLHGHAGDGECLAYASPSSRRTSYWTVRT
jgi:hypothetical protein